MAAKSEEAKARAEANFRKQQDRTREADQVHAENAAKARAIDQKTAGLKAQRLARDEAERVDAAAKARVSPPAKKPSDKRKRSIKVENLNAENDG
jgi:hypothetical protein